jgi:LysR family transcriptional regulator, salicylic acid-responsive activator of bsdBCD
VDVKRLRYFVTIAREGQITQAAKKLHMAQPPLSQQLKLLEEELDVLLLERNGRKMELTEAGKLLYEKAEALLEQMDETVKEVKETASGLRGVLSVGCVKSCFAQLPERIRDFRKSYPQVTFHLRSGDSYRLAEGLRNRDIELAIVRLPLEMDDFSSLPLPNEPYIAVVPERWLDSPTQTSIHLEDLAKMPLLLLHRISGIGQYEVVVNHFKNYGLEPNVVCECPDAAMILGLVSAEVGATIVPKSTLSTPSPEGRKILDIDGPELLSESAVIWLRNRYLSKNAKQFIETFQEC